MAVDKNLIEQLRATLPSFESLSNLVQKTANESAGPCPLCGGRDRFFVHGERGYCRRCNIKGGDLIDWHCSIEGTDLSDLLKKHGLSGNGSMKPKLVKKYDYTDADGHLVHQSLRYEPGKNGQKKSFSQRRPDGNGGWVWSLKGIEPVIYRLPEVVKAAEVFIVEGEKDADNLAVRGFTATTCPMGAGKWRAGYNKFLNGKDVVILPDNDEPGRKHAKKVAQSLQGIAGSIKIVSLPGLPEKGDTSDFLSTFSDQNEAAERLAILVDGAEPYTPSDDPKDEQKDTEEPPPTAPPAKTEMRITQDELSAADLSPPCIVKDYLFADLAALAAPGGTGKTTLVLYEMICITLGLEMYGLEIRNTGWCLYISAEDSREVLIARLREIMIEMHLTAEEQQTVMRRVLIWDVTGEPVKLIRARDGNIEPTSLADEIIEAYEADPPVLAVFDPLVSFGAGEGFVNDNEQGVITAGRRIIRGLGCCVRYIAHTGKQNARGKTLDQYTARGGSALPDGCRMLAVMQSWKPGDELKLPPGLTDSPKSSIVILARPKLSYAKPNQPLIWIKRTGWEFDYMIETPISEENRDKAFFDQVERFIASEVKVGHRHSKSSLETAIPDVKRSDIRRAVDQLLARGRIVAVPLPKEERQGGRQKYLTTADLAKCGEVDNDSKKQKSNPAEATTSPPLRENIGGEVEPPISPASLDLAETGRRDSAELAK